MAVTTGNDYDHVAIQNGSNTVLHYFKDKIFRNWSVGSDTVDFLTVKSCTPNSNKYFKLYIDDEGSLIVKKGDTWFDVDYYDGDEWLHTESIWTSGQNATWNETPTKEPTVDKTYTFAGWSRTNGGAVDANAKKNITADRNLYAVWNETVRTYTVTYWAANEQVEQKQVEYGGVIETLSSYSTNTYDYYIITDDNTMELYSGQPVVQDTYILIKNTGSGGGGLL